MDPANTLPSTTPLSNKPSLNPEPTPPPPMSAMQPDPYMQQQTPVYAQPQEPVAVSPSQPQSVVETPAPQTGAQSVITGGQEKKGISKFTLFVGIAVVVLIGVWAVVAYLYFGNKDMTSEETPEEVAIIDDTTPVFDPGEIQIINGDVSRLTAIGETQQLVRKEDYPGAGIIGFARVMVSPDNTKLCFESIPPASDPTIFISNVDGLEVTEIAKNKHTCSWSTDNNFLLYVNDPLGKYAINVYAYSLTGKEERNLTESTNTTTDIRQYTIIDVTADKILCTYDTVSTTGSKISTTNCQIDLATGEVTDRTE